MRILEGENMNDRNSSADINAHNRSTESLILEEEPISSAGHTPYPSVTNLHSSEKMEEIYSNPGTDDASGVDIDFESQDVRDYFKDGEESNIADNSTTVLEFEVSANEDEYYKKDIIQTREPSDRKEEKGIRDKNNIEGQNEAGQEEGDHIDNCKYGLENDTKDDNNDAENDDIHIADRSNDNSENNSNNNANDSKNVEKEDSRAAADEGSIDRNTTPIKNILTLLRSTPLSTERHEGIASFDPDSLLEMNNERNLLSDKGMLSSDDDLKSVEEESRNNEYDRESEGKEILREARIVEAHPQSEDTDSSSSKFEEEECSKTDLEWKERYITPDAAIQIDKVVADKTFADNEVNSADKVNNQEDRRQVKFEEECKLERSPNVSNISEVKALNCDQPEEHTGGETATVSCKTEILDEASLPIHLLTDNYNPITSPARKHYILRNEQAMRKDSTDLLEHQSFINYISQKDINERDSKMDGDSIMKFHTNRKTIRIQSNRNSESSSTHQKINRTQSVNYTMRHAANSMSHPMTHAASNTASHPGHKSMTQAENDSNNRGIAHSVYHVDSHPHDKHIIQRIVLSHAVASSHHYRVHHNFESNPMEAPSTRSSSRYLLRPHVSEHQHISSPTSHYELANRRNQAKIRSASGSPRASSNPRQVRYSVRETPESHWITSSGQSSRRGSKNLQSLGGKDAGWRGSGRRSSSAFYLSQKRKSSAGEILRQLMLEEGSLMNDRMEARTIHPPGLAWKKFRLVAKLVIVCSRWAHEHAAGDKSFEEKFPFVIALNYGDRELSPRNGRIFDPSLFKANRQLRVTEDSRRILSLRPNERTEEDLSFAQKALLNVKAYREYSIRMQKKIVSVGSYERYGVRRMILRQGHPASAFYFILSGSVAVLVDDGDSGVSLPRAYLHRGMTFGELAIINRTCRQSTIISKEPVELLSIGIEDFHHIFMHGGLKNITDPDHVQFMKSLSFLKDWPIEMIANESKNCVFHYYKRGDILVKDSNYSNWLVIVKSGSIEILKKLAAVKPKQNQQTVAKSNNAENNHNCEIEFKSRKQKREEMEIKSKQRRLILPEIRIPLRRHARFIDNILSDNINDKSNNEVVCLSKINNLSRNGQPQTVSEAQTRQRKKSVFGRVTEDDKVRAERLRSLAEKEEKVREELRTELLGRAQYVRTIADDLDAAYKYKDIDDVTAADLNPEYIRVQIMSKGEVFGLTELIFGKQPSFSVVSCGAECVLLDKSFYLHNLSSAQRDSLTHEIVPYPTDSEMQQKLQDSVNWKAYKRDLIEHTIDRQIHRRQTAAESMA